MTIAVFSLSTNMTGASDIFQRLGLIYQEDYIFEIKSRPGEGTTIYISVPLEYRRNAQGGEENEERTEH